MPKIRLTDEKNAARNTSYYLANDGSTIIAEKIANNQFVKFSLSSINENSTTVLSIYPNYVLCNFSKYQLNYYAFCIHRNEKLTYDDVARLLAEKSTPMPILSNHPTVDNM